MIVVDTSALVAIFLREPDALLYEEAIADASRAVVGSATAFEFVLVAFRKKGSGAIAEARTLLAAPAFEHAPCTPDHVVLAADALKRFGGRPARLNFGDCLAYATAKSLGAPLLYKGDDFRHTDIGSALD
ncbi:MAG: type II toxin-antitoxin system VapC family toxin [Sphingomonas sp.]